MPTNYCPGDSVVCKIGYSKILEANTKDFEFTQPLDIICLSDAGYIVLVPQTVHLTDSFTLTDKHCKIFGVGIKFADGEGYYISDDHIVSMRNRMTGLCCMKCNESYEYAEVNRIDANGHGALLCWSCRQYPFYK